MIDVICIKKQYLFIADLSILNKDLCFLCHIHQLLHKEVCHRSKFMLFQKKLPWFGFSTATHIVFSLRK